MRSSSKRSLPTEHSCPALATPAPNPLTGVPNKYYRGPQQGSASGARPPATPTRANKPKTRPLLAPYPPPATYRGPQQGLPGSPTNTTGVPDKYYRGARQAAFHKVAAKQGFS